ncbi:hypothetical protein JCGZ_18108 [Jatropha curcas]|uniref:Aminotransferase-like plant mobile domain-containing protein n=1 Tax=Jatropha curcas TaxID=180498 RepID=A0A067K1Y2_JATCU|nr:hypothetical protein JCGZ_18108 [Jatropha curcas]
MDQGLPLEPFLNKVLSMDVDPSWIRACCFLLLNVYVMKNRQPGVGDFRLLTVVRDIQLYHRTVFMMIMGETMCWVRDIALHVTNFNVHHCGCPILLQAWALDKLSLLLPARSMAYSPDKISRQYGMIQHVPRIHNFESGLMTLHLLANLADRWRNRNARYLGEGVMQDTVVNTQILSLKKLVFPDCKQSGRRSLRNEKN